MSSDHPVIKSRLWHNKATLAGLVLLALGLPIAYPDMGVLGSFVIAIVVVLIAIWESSAPLSSPSSSY